MPEKKIILGDPKSAKNLKSEKLWAGLLEILHSAFLHLGLGSGISEILSPLKSYIYFKYHYNVLYVRGRPRGRGERGEGVKFVEICGEVQRKERRSD